MYRFIATKSKPRRLDAVFFATYAKKSRRLSRKKHQFKHPHLAAKAGLPTQKEPRRIGQKRERNFLINAILILQIKQVCRRESRLGLNWFYLNLFDIKEKNFQPSKLSIFV
jgi:hypothetical protein